MKNYLLSVVMVLALSMATLSAHAEQVRVLVPHDFVVAGKLLHAGTYIISRASPVANGSRTLTLINLEGTHAGTFVLPVTFESKISDESKLRFLNTGGLYILTEIQTGS